MIPRIVIAGRPNVGKSTLFNRLLGSNRSVTHPQAGVTRDYVEAIATHGEQEVQLVDTGGIGAADSAFDDLVEKRSLRQLHAADIVLLVLDYSNYTPEDQDLVATCRKHPACILVLNKVDKKNGDPALEKGIGFPHTVYISAAHGTGITELWSAVSDRLAPSAKTRNESSREPHYCNIAIVGKPNSGKSCLLNALLGYDRSLVSEVAGTTRDSIDAVMQYNEHYIKIIDTAGLRRKSKVVASLEYYANLRAIDNTRRADVVLLLIEATQGVSDQDKKIAHIAISSGSPVIIVLSKSDLVTNAHVKELKSHVRFLFPHLRYAPICLCSALTKEGIDNVLTEALHVYRQLQQVVPTSKLNRHLQIWQQQLAQSGKRIIPVRYATQVSQRPVVFLFFAQKKLSSAHRRYFENCIRRDCGYTKIPIRLEVRSGA